jgi:hypothetical protein
MKVAKSSKNSATPSSLKKTENGEDRALWRMQTAALPVRARFRGLKFKVEAGQQGEGSDHRVG